MLWFWLGRLQCVLCLPVHYKLQYFPLSFAAIPKFGFIFASVHHFSVVYFSKSTFPVLKFLISQSKAVFTVLGPFLENSGNVSGLQSLICI